MDNAHRALLLQAQKRTTNHVLHLLLTLATCFFWLPVWVLTAQATGRHNRRIDRQIRRLV